MNIAHEDIYKDYTGASKPGVTLQVIPRDGEIGLVISPVNNQISPQPSHGAMLSIKQLSNLIDHLQKVYSQAQQE